MPGNKHQYDPDLLKGIHAIVNTDNLKPGVNYEEIERQMVEGGAIQAQETKDVAQAYHEELDDLAKSLGITMGDSALSPDMQTPRNRSYQSAPQQSSSYSPVGRPSSTQTTFQLSPGDSVMSSSPPHHTTTPQYSSSASPQFSASPLGGGSPGFDYSPPPVMSSQNPMGFSMPFASNSPRPSEFQRRTEEELRHEQVRSVMGEMNNTQNSEFLSLEEAKKEDEKVTMLEEIDSLRATLDDEGVKGLDKIPDVDSTNAHSEIENVLHRLRLKNDRIRYTGLADEMLLLGAQGIESVFNGKRTMFGARPNATGWHKQVQVKLRRMRHDTSTLVSGIMHGFNIGPGMRIILELVPNLFMHIKQQQNLYGKGDLYTDTEIAQQLSRIRNIDE